MQLSQALDIRSKQVVAFVGGGGKTSAMFRLADELVAQGKRVVTTTTTRLANSQTSIAPKHLVYTIAFDFGARVLDALEANSHVLITGALTEEGKTLGVPPAFVDDLIAHDQVDVVLVEADGARMRSFKAPADHEPVLPMSTNLLVPVIGIQALGHPLDEERVHRTEIVAKLGGARIGESITPMIAARVLAHPEGGIKGKPPNARAIVFINQVENTAQLDAAHSLSRLLLGYGEIDGVVIGAAQSADPIREAHRRVAAVVLAAGGGTRMQGAIKQLLPVRGKPLVANAIDLAAKSAVQQIIVVLGSRAEEVRLAIHDAPAQMLINREWETGHASSVRTGLRGVSSLVDAVVFLNADQPLLTSQVIDALIQRRAETGAHIVAPRYDGMRGSPVLFDRTHFGELLRMEAEQGGRDVMALHRDEIEWVDFSDARLGFDVDTPEEYARLTTMLN